MWVAGCHRSPGGGASPNATGAHEGELVKVHKNRISCIAEVLEVPDVLE